MIRAMLRTRVANGISHSIPNYKEPKTQEFERLRANTIHDVSSTPVQMLAKLLRKKTED
jgi:hypothetical protein